MRFQVQLGNEGKEELTNMAQARGLYETDPGPRFGRCQDDALVVLQEAADDWAKGDPENPPTKLILEKILRIFEKEKFLKRGLGHSGGFPNR